MKRFCSNCKKEIHIWHERYHAQADVDPIGWLKWLKIYLSGRPKAYTQSEWHHLDCNQAIKMRVFSKGFFGFGAIMLFFVVIAASFLLTQQSAIIPISGVGTFVLYWKDGAYLYGGSAAVCLFIMWHIYEDSN